MFPQQVCRQVEGLGLIPLKVFEQARTHEKTGHIDFRFSGLPLLYQDIDETQVGELRGFEGKTERIVLLYQVFPAALSYQQE